MSMVREKMTANQLLPIPARVFFQSKFPSRLHMFFNFFVTMRANSSLISVSALCLHKGPWGLMAKP